VEAKLISSKFIAKTKELKESKGKLSSLISENSKSPFVIYLAFKKKNMNSPNKSLESSQSELENKLQSSRKSILKINASNKNILEVEE